jgi:hypothetical protein
VFRSLKFFYAASPSRAPPSRASAPACSKHILLSHSQRLDKKFQVSITWAIHFRFANTAPPRLPMLLPRVQRPRDLQRPSKSMDQVVRFQWQLMRWLQFLWDGLKDILHRNSGLVPSSVERTRSPTPFLYLGSSRVNGNPRSSTRHNAKFLVFLRCQHRRRDH